VVRRVGRSSARGSVRRAVRSSELAVGLRLGRSEGPVEDLSGERRAGRSAEGLDATFLAAGATLGPFGVNFLMAAPSASPDAETEV